MSVELLQTLSLICYILAAVLLLIGITLFFYLKVPALWGEISGRTARKAIKAMKWKNEEAQKKPSPLSISQSKTSSRLYAKQPVANPLQEQVTSNPICEAHTDETSTLFQPDGGESSVLSQTDPGQTSVLAQSNMGQTSVLSQTDPGQTSVLAQSNMGQTSVLPQADPGQTSVLTRNDAGETALLDRSPFGETAVLNVSNCSERPFVAPEENYPTVTDSDMMFRKASPSQFIFILEKELAFTDSTEIIE